MILLIYIYGTLRIIDGVRILVNNLSMSSFSSIKIIIMKQMKQLLLRRCLDVYFFKFPINYSSFV